MRYFIALITATLWLGAQDPLTSQLLSPEQREEIRLQQEQATLSADILRDSWISTIGLSYGGSFDNKFDLDRQSYTGSISIDQPIFKSGGIYFGIRYAQANAHYAKLGIILQERALIAQVMRTILTLRKMDIALAQARLALEDAIDAVAYQRQLLNAGEIDIGQYNSTLINQNSAQTALWELEKSRQESLYTLSQLSSVDYATITLPTLSLLERDTFTTHHIERAQLASDIAQKEYAAWVTMSNYLPTLSLQAGYNYTVAYNQSLNKEQTAFDVAPTQYLSYGFKLSMPLAYNALRDIQKSRVDTLLAKTQMQSATRDIESFYAKSLAKVKAIESQIALARDTVALYEVVVAKNADLFASGELSAITLSQSRNAQKSKRLDIDAYTLERQIELLALYEKRYEAQP
ncbi:MAG: hypothetical protein KU37_02975 [Sulfuricurvum sp. PC08-66]|nr:MAG: hypothetical protein KU37_02975 [Sulfuricurvum sp. PC08-66]